MKKSVNRFAVLLWALAAAVLVGGMTVMAIELPRTWGITREASEFGTAVEIILSSIKVTLVNAALLFAAGYVIELLDQIRWNTRRIDS